LLGRLVNNSDDYFITAQTFFSSVSKENDSAGSKDRFHGIEGTEK
jgi:hypothetical protein